MRLGIRWAVVALPVILALVLGGVLATLSSSQSLSRGLRFREPATTSLHTPAASPSPAGSPAPIIGPPQAPPPDRLGLLGTRPRLVAVKDALLAADDHQQLQSTDGGRTWSPLRSPPGSSGLVVDRADPARLLAGGAKVLSSADMGVSWAGPHTAPPGLGPYIPVLISPSDASVWFLVHQGRLLRTRDAGQSWREIPGLPDLGIPVMVAGTATGQFYVATGGHVLELTDDGQQVQDRGILPGGASVLDLAVAGGGSPAVLARGSDGHSYLLKGGAWSASGVGLGGPVAGLPGGALLVGDGGNSLGTPARIAYSSDGGSTWGQATGLPTGETVEAIAVASADSGLYAYCFGGDLYKSSDGGRNWQLASTALRLLG